ncbi:BKACE family enzyme [Paramaledivibacter caminithermalis]|jgi:3-keto-5-aminohexanoate cleavage enzyme|uniref:3-keto-5-aminohexanoate cleavage enzyme n=1 Tax=Paramaledivibacter caminithermalis (strain DSM 15212 / CIP 107654 / DViRD3) TaxID=1121301 RepID=A0A1M6Q7Q7_PARC5|nr:3-keto-5-aminohexanoate cleavage protein [Paramaledivibacter caminithermalis]SHK16324.1 3-keto-5-aminohexanoate cleavage enzyme [Paramaledivibacter caminithermalis DSM 15212]
MEKLIITIAPTGNVPTKELNPHSPLTVDEIVSDIKKCHKLGAAIAHIHVRDGNLKPTSDRSIFKKVIDKLDEDNIGVIKQLSTGARGGANTIDWRGQMLDLNVHMASLATGSSNFAKSVNANSPELIKALAEKMYDNNIKPEIEAFDVAMIHNAIRLKKKGILKEPLHFNLVMNVPGSIPGTPKNLMFMIDSLPSGATWTVSGIGYSQVQMITMAILLGGHVRTGIEDVLKMEDGSYATNEKLVKRVIRIAKELGREIANVDEAKKILGLI